MMLVLLILWFCLPCFCTFHELCFMGCYKDFLLSSAIGD